MLESERADGMTRRIRDGNAPDIVVDLRGGAAPMQEVRFFSWKRCRPGRQPTSCPVSKPATALSPALRPMIWPGAPMLPPASSTGGRAQGGVDDSSALAAAVRGY